MNLYSYDYYDPVWHRYKPTQADVLTDAQIEKRRRSAARGISRALLFLPWPVLLVPPFVFKVGWPVAAVAILVGLLSSWLVCPKGIGSRAEEGWCPRSD